MSACLSSQGATTTLLNHADIIRIIRSGAWARLTKMHGLPPTLPSVHEISFQPLATLKLDDLNDFHGSISGFFGLPEMVLPKPSELFGEYATRILDIWFENSRAITFSTSGSTGTPKASLHSEEMLRQEVLEVSTFFTPKRVVVTVPLMHSYGFIFGLLLSKVLNIELVEIPPLSTIIMGMLKPGDLLVGFPMLFSGISAPAPPQVTALTATAPCSDALFESLERNIFSKVVEIYGTSETGAIAIRTAPGPFKLLNFWHKLDNDNLGRSLPSGEGVVKHMSSDYLNWHDDDHLTPTGRRDEAVQVGGVNVYPSLVAKIISTHPAVHQCIVRLMDTDEGERLKAFIVLHSNPNKPTVRRELRSFFNERLAPPERPGQVTFGASLPRTVSGKLSNWKI